MAIFKERREKLALEGAPIIA